MKEKGSRTGIYGERGHSWWSQSDGQGCGVHVVFAELHPIEPRLTINRTFWNCLRHEHYFDEQPQVPMFRIRK